MTHRPLKPIVLCLALCALTAAPTAYAQSTPGGGGGRHGGGGRGGGGQRDSGGGSKQTVPPADKPANQIVITGVVRAIDAPNDRITIDYDENEALGWPHGSKPFEVEKPGLLQGVTVGEKVKFKLESSQISEIKAF
ncbi:MAG TPA: copper-binding protein [Caulobacteraceae bacterium]|jgi:Cu/Ag efflux protein CusF